MSSKTKRSKQSGDTPLFVTNRDLDVYSINFLIKYSVIATIMVASAIGCDSSGNRNDKLTQDKNLVTVNAIEIKKIDDAVETATYFGILEPNRQRLVGFAVPGELESVAEIGSTVTVGQTLAKLKSTDLEQKKQSLESQIQQLGNNAGEQSTQLRNQLDSINRQLATRIIVAPYDSIISDTFTESGSLVQANSRVLKILESQKPNVKINLPKRIANWISPDQTIKFLIDDKAKQGTLKRKDITENPVGSTTVWLSITSELNDTNWTFGQAVEVRFAQPSGDSGFWLPTSSLSRSTDGVWSVFVLVTDDSSDQSDIAQVERRLVRIVQTQDSRVLAQGSLDENELIVENGLHRIVNGQRVKIRVKSNTQPNQSQTGGAD